MNLSVRLAGISFSNPTVLASGYLGVTGASLARCAQFGAGGVTSKTLFMEERKGHPNPTLLNFPGGLISSVGLAGEGVAAALREFEAYRRLAPASHPIIGSIGGRSLDELAEVARIMDGYPVDLLEINLSALNEGGGGCDPTLVAQVTKAVRKVVQKPLSVKLSPNVPDIALMAKRAEAEGADAITAINALGPGMLIDIEMRSPILSSKTGEVSGQAIKPIAVRCVYDIYKAVKIPIIATGGIMSGRDAVEMLMAGGTLLGIGSALMFHDMKAFQVITDGVRQFMQKEGVKDVKELVGAAHL